MHRIYLQQLGRMEQAERLQHPFVQLFCAQHCGHIGQQPDAMIQQEPLACPVCVATFAFELGVIRKAARSAASAKMRFMMIFSLDKCQASLCIQA